MHIKPRYARFPLGFLSLVDGDDAGGDDGDQSNDDGTSQDDGAGDDQQDDKGGRKAPWTEENFDAGRAAKLLENLTAERDQLRADRDKYKQSHEDAENAKLSDLQRAEKERDEAKTSGTEMALENARLKALIEHGLDMDDLEFIGGATPEEISERAKKYAERHGGAQKGGEVRQRPQPRLRGGANPAEEPDELDPRKLAESIPRI